MARISAEFTVKPYDDGSGAITVSLHREDITGEPYVAIKQGDYSLVTLALSAIEELQRALDLAARGG